MSSLRFRKISVPGASAAYAPTTIDLKFSTTTAVENHRLHLLAHIPWHDKYLAHVPQAYRNFFKFVLPYLSTRTSDVHTAISLGFVNELITNIDPGTNPYLAHLAVTLHDCGWCRVDDAQIADSLDYSGVIFTPAAAMAKHLHTVHGSQLAAELLRHYDFAQPLSSSEIDLISNIALWHERPLEYQINGRTPSALLVACEADRLWPFTHENFWLDVVRKGVEPGAYIQNVGTSVEGLFLTPVGQTIAWRLINERITEVAEYETFMARQTPTAPILRTATA
ncbi:MAG TPA: hypothetical protein VMT30_07955 [Candidatus Saccharimonadia bacterium]|nr:hypothetical protein [Candidatus Saccharimonadia bacterium]